MPNLSFSSITDRLGQLNLTQKIVLAVGSMLVLAAVLGFFILLPRWDELQMLKEDVGREEMKLAQITRARAQIARFKQELAEMDVRYQQLQAILPEAKEIPHLLRHVADLGQKQGLEFLLFRPEKEIPQEYITEIPIALSLKGYYHQIAIFFDGIRRLPRIINVRQFEFGGFEERTGRITARCQLVTYRITPSPPPSEKPKMKDEKKK